MIKKVPLPLVLFAMLIAAACVTKNPYKTTNKFYKKQADSLARLLLPVPMVEQSIKPGEFPVGTVNFNLRKPNFVVIHHTAQNSCDQTLRTFTVLHSKVSAHYVICKDGTIHHMLNDYLRAWHGGASKWGNATDLNSSSIGIEIDNNGFEKFTDAQVNSLLLLLARLKKDHSIPAANFVGHGDIAPGRKVDPNPTFPWKKLAENGFGLWQDPLLDSVPANFNSLLALRIIGYDVKDSLHAIGAFKRHFIPDDKRPFLTDSNKMILNNLYRKF
jgi:N-acetylmuramoyl-L-alanine amidase